MSRETDLANQLRQMRELADSVPALMALYDAETQRCLFANRSYAQTFGLDQTEIVGRTFAEVIGAVDVGDAHGEGGGVIKLVFREVEAESGHAPFYAVGRCSI